MAVQTENAWKMSHAILTAGLLIYVSWLHDSSVIFPPTDVQVKVKGVKIDNNLEADSFMVKLSLHRFLQPLPSLQNHNDGHFQQKKAD